MRKSAMRLPAAAAPFLAAGLLASCASIHEAGRTPIGGERGAVRVAVFADDNARAAGRLLGEPIAGELEQRRGGEWRPVFRTLEASWAVAGLEPGRYRVRFDRRLDATGAPEDLERPVRQTFAVRAGEAVDVELILDHVSPGVVAAGVVAAVVAAVVLHEWLDDHGLPHPPPPPRWALDAAFWISLDVAARPGPVWVPNVPAVQVTSHFQRAGEVVAPERVRVVFVLSEAIEGERLGDDAVVVTAEDGRGIPGRTRWDVREWWLVWEPFEPLPPGRRLRAEVAVDRFAAATGRDLAGATGFEFETAR
jgi:hypothetical protein